MPPALTPPSPSEPSRVPVLTDGVVTLRAHRLGDAEDCVEQCADPLSRQWTVVPIPYDLEDARTFITQVLPQGWESDREWGFAVEAHDPGQDRPRFAGTVSLRNRGSGQAEVAYGAHPWVRGRGVMERALRLLLAWGFETQGLQAVVWWANEGNWASRKLAWRLGFAVEGTVRRGLDHRGELVDGWVGTLLRQDERLPRHRWHDVPRLAGARVVLRRHRDDDLDRLVEACNDERTRHWLGRLPMPYDAAVGRRWLTMREEGMATGTAVHWMLADPGPGPDPLLGTVSVLRISPGTPDGTGGTGEIGYWAHPDARGRGLVSGAVALAVRHAFLPEDVGGLGLSRLELVSAVDNTASRHVAEVNGFSHYGTARAAMPVEEGYQDKACYELLERDWTGREGAEREGDLS